MKVKRTLKDGTVKIYTYDKKYPRTKKDYACNSYEVAKKYHRAKTTCECGLVLCKYSLKKHLGTKKHMRLMESKQSEN